MAQKFKRLRDHLKEREDAIPSEVERFLARRDFRTGRLAPKDAKLGRKTTGRRGARFVKGRKTARSSR